MLKEVTIDNKRSEYRFLIAVGIENVLSGGSKGDPSPNYDFTKHRRWAQRV
jgi:hypothetical protein